VDRDVRGLRRAAPTRLDELELEAWQALLHAHALLTSTLDAELQREHELTLGEYDILLRLARASGRRLRMSDLAQRVMVPPSSLTRVVDRLVARGLVSRERSGEDNRVVHAALTDMGRRRLRRAARTHLRGIREHFSGRLSDDQLHAVADGLREICGPHEAH
jgi:DNA-binding MarR family transcriptional regulator